MTVDETGNTAADFTEVVDAIEATAEVLRDNQYRYRVTTPYASNVYDNALDAAVDASDQALEGKEVLVEAITATIRFTEFTD